MFKAENDRLVTEFLDHLCFKRYSENSLRNYKHHLKVFLEELDHWQLSVLTLDVKAFELIAREWHGVATHTLNNRISRVRKFYDYLVRRGDMTANPVLKDLFIRPDRFDRPLLSRADVTVILEESASKFDHVQLAIRLMLFCGLRVSECRRIVARSITVYDTAVTFQVDSLKYNKSRTVVLRDETTANMLLQWLQYSHKHGIYLVLASQPACQEYLNSLKEALSFRPTTHDLRRYYATQLAREGVPVPLISKILGHESMATTLHYVFIKDTDLLEQFNVGALVGTPAP